MKMNWLKKINFILPFIFFAAILYLLWLGLRLHPNQIPSPLIGKAVPTFSLPTLFDEKKLTTEKDLKGHVTLVNVWATWCDACLAEHGMLLHLMQDEHVVFYGLNYKDNVDDAKKWLLENGNPFQIG